MKQNCAYRFDQSPAARPLTAQAGLCRNTLEQYRLRVVGEASQLTQKEQDCCDRATD